VLSVAVARSSYNDSAIILCTSGFVDDVSGDNVQIQVWSLRCSKLFTVTHQMVPLNPAPGTKSAIVDCLV